MAKVAPTSLFDLPTEIIWQIEAHLTTRDRTVCLRVCRAWYDHLIDEVWDTLTFPGRNMTQSEMAAAARAFYRNLHRIRVLKVHHDTLVDFYDHMVNDKTNCNDGEDNGTRRGHQDKDGDSDANNNDKTQKDHVSAAERSSQDPSPLISERQILRLEDLYVQFNYHPSRSEVHGLRPLLNLLERSPQTMKRFEVMINETWCPWSLHDESCLLVALPPSLEHLTLDYRMNHRLHRLHEGNGKIKKQKAAKFQKFISELSLPPLTARTTTGTTSTTTITTTPLCVLDKLKALSLRNLKSDSINLLFMGLLFLSRTPVLEELLFESKLSIYPDADMSAQLARLISKGSGGQKGWRTLGFQCQHVWYDMLDSQIVNAILEQSATLENLRISAPSSFSSSAIQQLLCSAPNLKRLDILPSKLHTDYELEPYMLLAKDITEVKSREWVCLGLESFKCMIGGIPRLDLESRTNGWSLRGIEYHDPDRYTAHKSRFIQRKVLGQLGRLTNLRQITLGLEMDVDLGRCYDSCCYESGGSLSDEEYCVEMEADPDPGQQYACLTLTLEDGLDLLKDLKSLRRIRFEKMSHCMTDKEREWMKSNWPEYGKEYIDAFWTERGHSLQLQEAQRLSSEKEDLLKYDWW
ncbi:hypothetical protein K457DRAFT_25129 [Linnemannia elongata AG-77]|uniref:F-box domain-containing protein n=1 Tax=Linnemannia elongata AG-77 TaxID=1314771 RepID=A0A197JEH4_9FUNG|nr:hypothetical protein K457DRAFT_25129 [Linnemannia elongata AG-77]